MWVRVPPGVLNLFEVDMQVNEIVKVREDCKEVQSFLKKFWFRILEFPTKKTAKVEVFYHPSFSRNYKHHFNKCSVSVKYKKNELKGSIYTIDVMQLTGDGK